MLVHPNPPKYIVYSSQCWCIQILLNISFTPVNVGASKSSKNIVDSGQCGCIQIFLNIWFTAVDVGASKSF